MTTEQEYMKQEVYVCHKCCGALTEVRLHPDWKGPVLSGCGCMSGYVREWQKPVTLLIALHGYAIQQDEWLTLFTNQKRAQWELEAQRVKLERARKVMLWAEILS